MLTANCPGCGASYNVDEAKVGPAGRKLKCARCGEIWVFKIEAAAEPAAEAVMEPQAAPVWGGGEEMQDLAQMGRMPWLQWVRGERLWLVGAALLCVIGAASGGWVLWHGRTQPVVEKAPVREEMKGIEAGVVKVPAGLQLREVGATFEEVSGTVVLKVGGRVVNGGQADVLLPPMKVELLDGNGLVQDLMPVEWVKPELAAGAEQLWEARLTNPPVQVVTGWRVVFE